MQISTTCDQQHRTPVARGRAFNPVWSDSQFHMKASLSHIEWNAELFMSSAFKRSFLRFSLRLARSAWRAALCAALCAALRASLRFARRVA